MDPTHQPRDRFFKRVFSDPATAAEFIAHYLPAEMVSLMDLDSLRATGESFVDEHLTAVFSDLVYTVGFKSGQSGSVYILFEHKSYPEPMTAFYLIKSMVRIWDRCLANRAPLSVILPIVIYHGKDHWNFGHGFGHLVEAPEPMRGFVPEFRYWLWDASAFTDEQIKGQVLLKVGLLLFKHVFDNNLKEQLPPIFSLMRELSQKHTGLEYIELVLRYILSAVPKGVASADDCKAALQQLIPEKVEEIMRTAADDYIEKGIEKGIGIGMQQGILQKSREAVLDILEARFSVVPGSIYRKIQDIDDPAVLKALLRQAVTIGSFDEFKKLIDLAMA